MKDFVEIVRELINQIDFELKVLDVVGDKIYVCKTLNVTIGKIITDSLLNQYKVIDIMNDEWIQVTPIGAAPNPFSDSVVICNQPTYLHGTPSSVNNEYLQISKQTRNKTPFIWLLENYDEETFGIESSVERSTKFRMFFLDETNERRWLNGQHHKYVIQPMQNLIDAFIESIKSDSVFKTFESIQRKPRVRFGVYVENKGNTAKIIDEDLSGVEFSMNLAKYKCNNKKCII